MTRKRQRRPWLQLTLQFQLDLPFVSDAEPHQDLESTGGASPHEPHQASSAEQLRRSRALVMRDLAPTTGAAAPLSHATPPARSDVARRAGKPWRGA